VHVLTAVHTEWIERESGDIETGKLGFSVITVRVSICHCHHRHVILVICLM